MGNDINKGTLKVQYVKAEGTVSKTKYTNIFVNGDKSFKISPYGLTDMFKLEDKSKVEIEGYLVSVSKYGIFNVALTKVTKK